jgi:hypothetical protein
LENVDVFYGHLDDFTDIWDFLRPFGTLFRFPYHTYTKKNLATLVAGGTGHRGHVVRAGAAQAAAQRFAGGRDETRLVGHVGKLSFPGTQQEDEMKAQMILSAVC